MNTLLALFIISGATSLGILIGLPQKIPGMLLGGIVGLFLGSLAAILLRLAERFA